MGDKRKKKKDGGSRFATSLGRSLSFFSFFFVNRKRGRENKGYEKGGEGERGE